MSNIQRQPDHCPAHPGPALTSTRRWSPWGNPEGSCHILVQHRCAQGCNTALGWMYRGPGGVTSHGPGVCRDPEVLQKMGEQQDQADSFNQTMITFLILTFVTIAAFIIVTAATGPPSTWTVFHTAWAAAWTPLSIAVMSVPLTMARRRAARRRRDAPAA